jgi:hypothetical protein
MNNVCAVCIGESYLQTQIMQEGKIGQCDCCQSEDNPTVPLDELAQQIHSVLEDHYRMTSPDPEGVDFLASKEGYWEQPGEPVTVAIMNLIDSSEELAEAVREYLSDQYDPHGKHALVDPCPYAEDSQYEERPIDTYEYQESWDSFRQEILSRARFFNQTAKFALEHLFQGVAQLSTHEGDSVVRILNSEDSIFRGRLANSFEALEEIIKSAPESMGAPPSRHASAGRMNAEGISVFYGATDIDTCIAEIRAPVGGYVVVGRFELLNELRLLDLAKLRAVFLSGSLFDHEHTESLSRVQFLKQLESELTQPVVPGSESRDYLPTQVVAEYLADHPEMQLDGIMFASSQVSSEEGADASQRKGKNVVLFSTACGLRSDEVPDGTEINVHHYLGDPEDPDPTIFIQTTVPDTSEDLDCAPAVNTEFGSWDLNYVPALAEDTLEPRLRLDMEGIEVKRVEGVCYQTFDFGVYLHQSVKDDSDF